MRSFLKDSVPVLMYHHVLPKRGFIAMSVDDFRAQMEYIAKSGYKTLSLSEFEAFKLGKIEPKKALLISFDDGWRDNLVYAYPILKEFGLKATIFVITEWVELASNQKRGSFAPKDHKSFLADIRLGILDSILSWDELDSMRDVFDIASHSHSHRDFYFKKSYSWDEECEISKELLKDRLGIVNEHFCWPRGKFDSVSKSVVLKYFRFLHTTKRGANLANNQSDIYRISTKEGLFWLKKSLLIYSSSLLADIYGIYKR